MMSVQPQTALSPQLAQLSSELEQCTAGLRVLVSGMDDAAIWKRPAIGGWCVGECIDHLAVSSRQFIPRIEAALQNAPRSDGAYKTDLRGRLLIWFLEPPYRMRFKVVDALRPGSERPKSELLDDFIASQSEVQSLIARANGVALDRVTVISPVDARMKYNAFSALKIIPAHQRRHLWQATRIKQHI
jgi:DinB family protein